MIDWKEAFPNPEQFVFLDCENEVNNDCKPYINFFNERKEKAATVTQLKALIESELEGLEAHYNNIEPCKVVRSLDGINLYPLYKSGWNTAISMLFEITNNGYKHMPEIKEQVLSMYNETGTPPGYFETLSKISIEEEVSGMVDAKYYLYLKEQLRLTEQKTDIAVVAGNAEIESEELVKNQVREILQRFFINSDEDRFNSLVENIITKVEKEYYPILQRNGTKTDLYKALMKLIRLKIADRVHLAFVISKSCNDMDYDQTHRKMSK